MSNCGLEAKFEVFFCFFFSLEFNFPFHVPYSVLKQKLFGVRRFTVVSSDPLEICSKCQCCNFFARFTFWSHSIFDFDIAALNHPLVLWLYNLKICELPYMHLPKRGVHIFIWTKLITIYFIVFKLLLFISSYVLFIFVAFMSLGTGTYTQIYRIREN